MRATKNNVRPIRYVQVGVFAVVMSVGGGLALSAILKLIWQVVR